MSKPDQSQHPDCKTTRNRRRFVIAGSAMAVLTALVATSALVFAHGRGGHGWDGSASAEEIAEHIERRVQYALSDIGTTDEQTAQITSIVQAAAHDVHAMHDQHGATHQQLKEIVSAASVDRSRLEAL